MRRSIKIVMLTLLLAAAGIAPVFASFYANAQLEARLIAIQSWSVDADGIVRLGAEIQLNKLLSEGGHAKMGGILVGQRVSVTLIVDPSIKALKAGDRFVVEWATFNSLGPDGVVEGTSYRALRLL